MSNAFGGKQLDYDLLLGEHNILRKKLDSKTEALLILTNDLEECRTERDQLRSFVEQMKSGRYVKNRQSIDNKILTQNLCEYKEKNKILQIEMKDLKQKLQDSEGDMKVLREQIGRQRQGSNNIGDADEVTAQPRHFSAHERDCLVTNLESVKMRYALLERDLQSILDEKEELITARDAYKHKVDRLNHELHYALKGDDSKKVIDIDSLLMENRYLQERLKQTQEEKSLYMQTLSKYKSILEKRRNKSALKLGTHSGGSGSLIVTHKQVEQMLQDASLAQLPATHANIADLRSLALALFESLNDKNIALAHQKKTNKILGHRLAELENKLSVSEFTPTAWIQSEETLEDSDKSSPTGVECCSKDDSKDQQNATDKPFREDSINSIEELFIKASSNGAVRLVQCSNEHSENLIRQGSFNLAFVEQRTPPTTPTEATGTSTGIINSINNSHQKSTLGQILSNSDEDLPPKLRKLVQDAMDDLDRRLSTTSME